jgi:hypothetical protein
MLVATIVTVVTIAASPSPPIIIVSPYFSFGF